MSRIKILIVEDELIIAQDISFKLQDLGYQVVGMVSDQDEMTKVLQNNTPDLILFDVELNGDQDGIDLAAYVRNEFRIPFVYLTSHADLSTVLRAKDTRPNGYILKPIEKNELFASIEMALSNANDWQEKSGKPDGKHLFVQHKEAWIKVEQSNILWLKAGGNYTEIHTKEERYLVRGNIKETQVKMQDYFCRIHKSFVVNLNKIDRILTTTVMINDQEVPIGKMYKEDFLLNINKL